MDKLLLHTCCGVCGVYVLEKLKEEFEVTAYFYNPNIHPQEEYKRRREAVRQICSEASLPFVEGEYQPESWFTVIAKECNFDFKNEPEGGRRCPVCFKMRLEESARYAHENGFEWLATTLTMGRNKKAEVINPIGQAAAQKYGLKFYEADWKKQNGQLIAHQLAKEKDIYRQHYCGCVFSV